MGRLRGKLCVRCGTVTRASKPKPRKHAAADRKWSKAVRERDGHTCQRCSRPAGESAHIIRRGYKATRLNPDNGLALCHACADYLTRHPNEWREWLEKYMPGLAAEMAALAGAPIK